MIIRWQMGPYKDGPSWDALDLSIRLMQKLEPTAEYHVTHQGELIRTIPNVIYHPQSLPEGAPYCDGRHIPLRFDLNQHEAWLDNDHIMWELPPGWKTWKAAENSVLIWRADWDYYGMFGQALRMIQPDTSWNASAGMWGLPPGAVMPAPEYHRPESRNMDEYGLVILWLASQHHHEYIYQEEVPVYCPDHSALKDKDKIGTHGVHLNGLNRRWNARGCDLLYELRKKYL